MKVVLSILSAFLVFYSSLNWNLNMHLCGGKIVEYSLFEKTKGCGMEELLGEKSACSNQDILNAKSCCKDQSLKAFSQTFKKGNNSIEFISSPFTFQKVFFVQELTGRRLKQQEKVYFSYRPPPIIVNVFTFFQIFRL